MLAIGIRTPANGLDWHFAPTVVPLLVPRSNGPSIKSGTLAVSIAKHSAETLTSCLLQEVFCYLHESATTFLFKWLN